MTPIGPTVFIVDDDPGVLKALTRLVSTAGYGTRAFASANEFLQHHEVEEPGCALFDISMPEVDGLQLQASLAAHGIDRPIVFVTGRGDIRKTVLAMRGGAVDFLTKPVHAPELLAAIARATEQDAQHRQQRCDLLAVENRVAQLTPREKEVMKHVVAGRLNKQIAGDLGTVEKTIKVHRGRMMAKMGIRTVAELVRLTEHLGIWPHKQ